MTLLTVNLLFSTINYGLSMDCWTCLGQQQCSNPIKWVSEVCPTVQEHCYKFINEDGSVFKMGCTLQSCSAAPGWTSDVHCDLCTTNLCNGGSLGHSHDSEGTDLIWGVDSIEDEQEVAGLDSDLDEIVPIQLETQPPRRTTQKPARKTSRPPVRRRPVPSESSVHVWEFPIDGNDAAEEPEPIQEAPQQSFRVRGASVGGGSVDVDVPSVHQSPSAGGGGGWEEEVTVEDEDDTGAIEVPEWARGQYEKGDQGAPPVPQLPPQRPPPNTANSGDTEGTDIEVPEWAQGADNGGGNTGGGWKQVDLPPAPDTNSGGGSDGGVEVPDWATGNGNSGGGSSNSGNSGGGSSNSGNSGNAEGGWVRVGGGDDLQGGGSSGGDPWDNPEEDDDLSGGSNTDNQATSTTKNEFTERSSWSQGNTASKSVLVSFVILIAGLFAMIL